jgi:hypothetical protein
MPVKESKNSNAKPVFNGILLAIIVSAATAGLIYYLEISGFKH